MVVKFWGHIIWSKLYHFKAVVPMMCTVAPQDTTWSLLPSSWGWAVPSAKFCALSFFFKPFMRLGLLCYPRELTHRLFLGTAPFTLLHGRKNLLRSSSSRSHTLTATPYWLSQLHSVSCLLASFCTQQRYPPPSTPLISLFWAVAYNPFPWSWQNSQTKPYHLYLELICLHSRPDILY